MKTEALLAFQAFIEAKAKMHSIRDYLNRDQQLNIMGLYPEIHVFGEPDFYKLADAYKAVVTESPFVASEKMFDTRLTFNVTSKEYGITFEVFCLREAEKGEGK